MKAKVLMALLGLAALALPAAVPASQPGRVKLVDLDAAVAVTPATPHLTTLLADPNRAAQLSVELPTRYTTLEWINQDPFAL